MKSLNNYITEFININNIKIIYDAVDLDLPSGTKWATCNIGADSPEDYGLLFQWARTDGYAYNDVNNKFINKSEYQTSSGAHYKTNDTLDLIDDIAYKNSNGKLKMPTRDDMRELLKNTNSEWTTIRGVNGRKFISKKDKSKWIFIPAAGYYIETEKKFDSKQEIGLLWSSSTSNDDYNYCAYLDFDDDDCSIYNMQIYCGLSIRGVSK